MAFVVGGVQRDVVSLGGQEFVVKKNGQMRILQRGFPPPTSLDTKFAIPEITNRIYVSFGITAGNDSSSVFDWTGMIDTSPMKNYGVTGPLAVYRRRDLQLSQIIKSSEIFPSTFITEMRIPSVYQSFDASKESWNDGKAMVLPTQSFGNVSYSNGLVTFTSKNISFSGAMTAMQSVRAFIQYIYEEV